MGGMDVPLVQEHRMDKHRCELFTCRAARPGLTARLAAAVPKHAGLSGVVGLLARQHSPVASPPHLSGRLQAVTIAWTGQRVLALTIYGHTDKGAVGENVALLEEAACMIARHGLPFHRRGRLEVQPQ